MALGLSLNPEPCWITQVSRSNEVQESSSPGKPSAGPGHRPPSRPPQDPPPPSSLQVPETRGPAKAEPRSGPEPNGEQWGGQGTHAGTRGQDPRVCGVGTQTASASASPPRPLSCGVSGGSGCTRRTLVPAQTAVGSLAAARTHPTRRGVLHRAKPSLSPASTVGRTTNFPVLEKMLPQLEKHSWVS